MMHNIDLPQHRYVWVRDVFVHRQPVGAFVPAVWWGVSSTPGRMLGCHVLLESGAMVLDLPLHALACRADAPFAALDEEEAQAWDAFGWRIEATQPAFLSGLTAGLLDAQHHATAHHGTLWFAVDWLDNGYSMYPEQHKWLWIVARWDGHLVALPQDRLLVQEASFTDITGVPPIVRQATIWTSET